MKYAALQGPHSSLNVRRLNGERKQIKIEGIAGCPQETFFETTHLRTSENAPFNRYLLLYTYIYIQSGSEDNSTSTKTDTHQNFRDMNHSLANEKGSIRDYWGEGAKLCKILQLEGQA